jgi:threonylcarbamoyladenosine tRNA methylthiotransferase MtaB
MISRYQFTMHTFGCKVNTYDSGLLQSRLQNRPQSLPQSKEAQSLSPGASRVHILNTCAVTADASREAAKLARRIKAREPLATVVVTGCGAQVDGELFDNLPAADLIIANSHKGQLERILDQYFKGAIESKVFRSNIFRKEDLEAGGGTEEGHTRVFLKIQDGCNSFCTYCVIPFARGKSRSIPVRELVGRINELASAGEVVLTGVHIADYEDKVGDRTFLLHDLIAEVLEKTQVPRLRLTSLEPCELTPEVLRLYRSERMCPHFHMSIQSANNRVLTAMRRKYDAQAVEDSLLAIDELVPGAFVGIDVIAGFPGETDEEFAETYERLARLPWTRLHVFPYSERPGTKAAAFDGAVPRELRALRSQRLRELSSERFATHASKKLGQETVSMILRAGLNSARVESLTRDYWPVRLTGVHGCGDGFFGEDLHDLLVRTGREVRVKIIEFKQAERMEGVLIGHWMRENS